MRLGMPLAEYEARVGPATKLFHEQAEMTQLSAEGVLPLDPDDREDIDGQTSRQELKERGHQRA